MGFPCLLAIASHSRGAREYFRHKGTAGWRALRGLPRVTQRPCAGLGAQRRQLHLIPPSSACPCQPPGRGTAVTSASETAPPGCQGRVSLWVCLLGIPTPSVPHMVGNSLAGPERASAASSHQEKYFGFSRGGSQGSSLAPPSKWELETWNMESAALKWKPLCRDLCQCR